MDGSPETTNMLLAVMAAVSALEGLLIIGAAVACFMVYRTAMRCMSHPGLIEGSETAWPRPWRAHAIDDVTSVSATVRGNRAVDSAIHHTIDRVDDTVGRVRTTVRQKTSRLVGLVRGARVALETVLESRS